METQVRAIVLDAPAGAGYCEKNIWPPLLIGLNPPGDAHEPQPFSPPPLACALALLICSSAAAGQISKPHTFSPGTPAKAEEVNADFDALYDQVNTIGSQVTVDQAGGRVGIGTASPDDKLDVNGTIHSQSGGVKFPDNTVQTTAASRERVAYIKDVKPSGTNGGDCTAGSWLRRDLNTVEGDASLVSLSNNQFTLQPGTYQVEALAPAFVTSQHKTALYSVTAGGFSLIGSVGYSNTSSPSLSYSHIYGALTPAVPTVYELQHRCSVTRPTNGLGIPASYGVNEVYSQIKITKVE